MSESDSDDSSIIFVNDLNAYSSDSDQDTDHDHDEEMQEFEIEPDDEEYDEIYAEDSEHVYSEKEDGHCYIGIAKYMVAQKVIMMVNTVSPSVFFRYSYKRISEYLAKYSILRIQNAKIHIMKLCILPDDTYSVVLKTHWIRLIQRHWKKVFRERKRVIKGRLSFNNRYLNEINGRYPYGLNRIPSICGMLSCY
jgi:hypothetical protein